MQAAVSVSPARMVLVMEVEKACVTLASLDSWQIFSVSGLDGSLRQKVPARSCNAAQRGTGTFSSIRTFSPRTRRRAMWSLRRKPTPTLERAGEGELIGLARGGSGAALREIMRRHNRRL